MKSVYEFYSDDINELVKFFGAVETIESVFDIRYAWANGSFNEEDEGDGSVDPLTIMYKNKVYRSSGILKITYEDDLHKYFHAGEQYSKPVVKLKG